MHEFVCLNNKILSVRNTFLSAVSSAALYGKGIFTTVAVYNSKPFLWEKHWKRLKENAQKIGINLAAFKEESVEKSLLDMIAENNFRDGRARLTFFDESAGGAWKVKNNRQISFLIQTADFLTKSKKFRLCVSPFRVNSTSPLAGVKSCNYLENIMAFEDAKKKGFDEAIRLNEKSEVVSVCMANVFWKKNGAIFTPDLETGCLEGTTRAFVAENFSIENRRAELEELKEADEIFLTSAGIGIVKVASLEIY